MNVLPIIDLTEDRNRWVKMIVTSPWGNIELTWEKPGVLYSARFIDNIPGPLRQWPHVEAIATPMATSFEVDVFTALQTVGWGQTITYSQLAERAGHHKAARPVGNLLAINRVALLLPCHRVVPAHPTVNEPFGRYVWGAERKNSIINFERRTIETPLTL